MVRKFIVVTQLQIEMSEEIKQQLKQIALEQNVTLKYLVLDAIATKYPSIKNALGEYLPRHTREKEYR